MGFTKYPTESITTLQSTPTVGILWPLLNPLDAPDRSTTRGIVDRDHVTIDLDDQPSALEGCADRINDQSQMRILFLQLVQTLPQVRDIGLQRTDDALLNLVRSLADTRFKHPDPSQQRANGEQHANNTEYT